ncbi:hypothetical protein RclHR1_06460002 [Rhizophagus clarus]|uniref:Uncharacterized protein n=1 Tax=Rhizophagus clarus TaxID=94130 RepID=A0A2Z6RUB8_9GLOM|nr:hypothetical protein RclHR1_06460002 [Rhizophagus clarus]
MIKIKYDVKIYCYINTDLLQCSSLSGIEKGSLVCQQRQAQSKVHRVTFLQETQFLSAHNVLHLRYWLKTIEEIPTL